MLVIDTTSFRVYHGIKQNEKRRKEGRLWWYRDERFISRGGSGGVEGWSIKHACVPRIYPVQQPDSRTNEIRLRNTVKVV